MAENVLAQSVRMPRLAPTFSRTDEISFKLLGIVLSGATCDLFPQGTSCRREGIPGHRTVIVRCSNHSAEHSDL